MKNISRLLAAAALGLPAFAWAGISDEFRFPNVEYGEREIDIHYGSEKMKDSEGGARTSEGTAGFGYGATQWWFTEAYFKWKKETGDKTKFDAFELENTFLLTETNKYPVDVGFFIELEIPKQRVEGYEWSFGPLFQFDTGAVRWNVNPVLEKVTSNKEGGEHPLALGYQAQASYRLANGMDVGVQALGELGKWNDWEPHNDQLHRIGPAIYGKLKLEGRQFIKYNAAYFVGLTDATPKNSFRLQVENEF